MVVLVRPLELHKDSCVSPRLFIKYLMLFFRFSDLSFLCMKCLPVLFIRNQGYALNIHSVLTSEVLDYGFRLKAASDHSIAPFLEPLRTQFYTLTPCKKNHFL